MAGATDVMDVAVVEIDPVVIVRTSRVSVTTTISVEMLLRDGTPICLLTAFPAYSSSLRCMKMLIANTMSSTLASRPRKREQYCHLDNL